MKHYSQACQYSTRLIEKLESLDLQNTLDFDLIDKAIYWAKKYHDGQYRKSGEPFYSHPLEVAYIVCEAFGRKPPIDEMLTMRPCRCSFITR